MDVFRAPLHTTIATLGAVRIDVAPRIWAGGKSPGCPCGGIARLGQSSLGAWFPAGIFTVRLRRHRHSTAFTLAGCCSALAGGRIHRGGRQHRQRAAEVRAPAGEAVDLVRREQPAGRASCVSEAGWPSLVAAAHSRRPVRGDQLCRRRLRRADVSPGRRRAYAPPAPRRWSSPVAR